MTRALEKHIWCKVLTLPCGFVRPNQESQGESPGEKRGDQGTSLGSWNQSMEGSLGVGCVTAVPRLPGTAAEAGTRRHSVGQGWGRGHTKQGVVGQRAEVRNYRRMQLKTNSKLKGNWPQHTKCWSLLMDPSNTHFLSPPTHSPASPTLQVI